MSSTRRLVLCALLITFAGAPVGCVEHPELGLVRAAHAQDAAPQDQDEASVEAEPDPAVPAGEGDWLTFEDGGQERWQVPALGARDPYFPLLPGEDPKISRSVGDVSHGYLVHAAQLQWPHPHLATLKVQSERHLIYGTDALLTLIAKASAHVAKRHDQGTITYLGNIAQRGGGDIRWSVSHNSGRDADLAFFVTDERGEPAVMPDLLPLDETGRYEGEHGVFLFDVPRSWSLVEGLILAGQDQLQYIFVADWLRAPLLEHARAIGADAEVLRRATSLLQQPRATLPHNDHFHVRIYCTKSDVASGCQESGRAQPWLNRHSEQRREVSLKIAQALKSQDQEVRVAAMRRAALMQDRSHVKALIEGLEDERPKVRAAAARALGELGQGDKAIGQRLLRGEPDDRVVVELVDALSVLGTSSAIDALVKSLAAPKRELRLSQTLREDVRLLAADALATTESVKAVAPLIALLADESPRLRQRAALALRLLTNHSFLEDWEGSGEELLAQGRQAWAQWWAQSRRKGRQAWLMAGFEQAGLPIEKLNKRSVWTLCRAIDAQPHTTYNAQRLLMRLVKHDPKSLGWSWQDANFYWRRWLERRQRALGLPPIPPELSTKDGYAQLVKGAASAVKAAPKAASKSKTPPKRANAKPSADQPKARKRR